MSRSSWRGSLSRQQIVVVNDHGGRFMGEKRRKRPRRWRRIVSLYLSAAGRESQSARAWHWPALAYSLVAQIRRSFPRPSNEQSEVTPSVKAFDNVSGGRALIYARTIYEWSTRIILISNYLWFMSTYRSSETRGRRLNNDDREISNDLCSICLRFSNN